MAEHDKFDEAEERAWNISDPRARQEALEQIKLQRRGAALEIVADAARKDQAQAYCLDKLTAKVGDLIRAHGKLEDRLDRLTGAVDAKKAAIAERTRMETEANEAVQQRQSRLWSVLQPILRSPAVNTAFTILLFIALTVIAQCAGVDISIPGIGETHDSGEVGSHDTQDTR